MEIEPFFGQRDCAELLLAYFSRRFRPSILYIRGIIEASTASYFKRQNVAELMLRITSPPVFIDFDNKNYYYSYCF